MDRRKAIKQITTRATVLIEHKPVGRLTANLHITQKLNLLQTNKDHIRVCRDISNILRQDLTILCYILCSF